MQAESTAYLTTNGQAGRSRNRRRPEGLQQDAHPLAGSLRVQDGAAGADGKRDCILVFRVDCTCLSFSALLGLFSASSWFVFVWRGFRFCFSCFVFVCFCFV